MTMIENQQINSFKSYIKDKMSPIFYMCAFYATFLGPIYFPTNEQVFSEIKRTEKFDIIFKRYSTKIINSVNLSKPVNDFFIAMTNIDQSENFISECLGLYYNVNGLDKTREGPNILKCLEISQQIEFI
jgi:hypothetical protein